MNSYPLEYFKAVQDVLCSEENTGDDPFAEEILNALASVGALRPPSPVVGKPTKSDVYALMGQHLVAYKMHGCPAGISGKDEFVDALLAAPIWPTAEPPELNKLQAEADKLVANYDVLAKLIKTIQETKAEPPATVDAGQLAWQPIANALPALRDEARAIGHNIRLGESCTQLIWSVEHQGNVVVQYSNPAPVDPLFYFILPKVPSR